MAMAMGRSGVNVCTLGKVEFKDARKCKELNLADMVSNIRLVRTNPQFSAEDKKTIESLYYKVYPVFETSGSAAIKRQIEENRLGEAIYQLCAGDNFAEKKSRLQDVITHISRLSKKQLDNVLQSMSLELDNYTVQHDSRIYIQGIRLAENFKKMFLAPLKENGVNLPTVLFHIFDTDFYILTIYDHLGNTAKCNEYLENCLQNIGFLSSSAEHLDYYFNFCIRRLNMIKDNFDFETALEKCRSLEKTLSDMKEWYSAIETEELGTCGMKYPLLGKVYGIEVQTLTNLLSPSDSSLLAEAEAASDKAMAEFTDPEDISRQCMYRCQLYCAAGRSEESLRWLSRSCGIEHEVSAYQKMLDYAFESGRVNVYVLLHYTNTMVAFCENQPDSPEFQKMMDVLTRHKSFNAEIKQHDEGYPWNMINFNMYRAFSAINQPSAAEKYYRKALKINEKNPDNATMLSFSIAFRGYAVIAKNPGQGTIPQGGKKSGKNAASADTPEMSQYKNACTSLFKKSIPQAMREWFGGDNFGDISQIKKNAKGYLK